MTLGLCMIVKDEEEVLGRCLQSVQGVFDEIYITDTGSHDNTPRIAAQFTPFVFRFPWRQDFAAARNASFAPARTDYIMWLDADDVLLPQARQALLDLKPRLGEADCWYLRYDAAFDAHGNVTLHFRRERIVRRSCGFVWEGAVHETLQVSGTAAQADISVTHLRAAHKEQGRNLRIFARLFADGKTPCSRQKYYFARELEDSGLYDTAACAYEWFLRGSGWAEDKICACRGLARCHAACGRRQEQLEALLRSFAYAPPRAETCCCVGRFFVEEGNWKQAVFWFRLALRAGKADAGGFVCPDASGYIPYMWLCVCYDKLGDIPRARACNELAGRCKPQDENYLHNARYFASLEQTAQGDTKP